MKQENRVQVIAAAQVFVGGACYGANATMFKTAFAQGFTWPQVVECQMWSAAALFALAVVVRRTQGNRWEKLGTKTLLKLAGLGCLTCTTSILYCFAMSRLPVAVAITLLFQFTWIGLAIQVITTRRPPRLGEVAAALVIIAGTVLASGVYRTGIAGYDPIGLVCALLSAVSCALFLALSGKVSAPCHSTQRGLLISLGACAMSMTICPGFLLSGAATIQGIAPFGLVTGFFGMMLPVILFGLGSPHLPAGVSTVMAASELPAGLLISMVALGEAIGPVQWVGVAVILAGVVISQAGNLAFAKEARSVRMKEKLQEKPFSAANIQ